MGMRERIAKLERMASIEAAQPAPDTKPGEIAVPVEHNTRGQPVRWFVIGAEEALL